MRHLLLTTIALTGLVAATAVTASAAPLAAPLALARAEPDHGLVIKADYDDWHRREWRHHEWWHHRHWEHNHWHYYN